MLKEMNEQDSKPADGESGLNAGLGVWHPIETVPVHTSVLFWRKDSGWFEGKYTSLDGELSDSEIENSEMTEEEIFEMGYWWFSARGITSLSDDEKPTYWMIPLEPNTPNV